MRSRTIREGSVGLLILLGLALFAGLILWLRGLTLGNRSFKVIFEFANVAGMQPGTQVRYRGVAVGRITETRPGPNGVEVEAELSPADLVIPKAVLVQANQSGLLGEASIDLTPTRELTAPVAGKPLDPNCDRSLIVCDKSRLPGQVGVSVDELVRATIRFANTYSDPTLTNNINAVAKNSAEAAAEVTKLTREFSVVAKQVQREIGTFSQSAQAVSSAANQFGLTAVQANELLATNRSSLVSTLNNINAITTELRSTVTGLTPVVDRVQQGALLQNLETLSANAAQASADFRDISRSLNNPSNVLVLQQTLDSARVTFQNVQKITADLDELTGDPAFRDNLRNLVNGLSGLVSSTERLQQQAQLERALSELAVDRAAASPTSSAVPAPRSAVPAPQVSQ